MVCSHSFCIELYMPPMYTPLIRRYTHTTDSTPIYPVGVGCNTWFILMDTAHTSQTPVQGYCVTGALNLLRMHIPAALPFPSLPYYWQMHHGCPPLSLSLLLPLVSSPSPIHPASRGLQQWWWWWCPHAVVVVVSSSMYLVMKKWNRK